MTKLPLVVLLVSGVLPGCATRDEDRAPAAIDVPPSQRMQLPVVVSTSPPGAQVFINGRLIGSAPIQAVLDTDRQGALLEETEITADFSLLFAGETSPLTVQNQTLWRGDKPPRVLTFQAEEQILRGR